MIYYGKTLTGSDTKLTAGQLHGQRLLAWVETRA